MLVRCPTAVPSVPTTVQIVHLPIPYLHSFFIQPSRRTLYATFDAHTVLTHNHLLNLCTPCERLVNVTSTRIINSIRLSFQASNWRIAALLLLVSLLVSVIVGAVVSFLSPLIAFAAIAGIGVLLLMLRSPQWGLYATIGVAILLPFGALPIDVGFKPTFLDGAIGMAFFVWFMRLAAGRVRRMKLTLLAPLVLAFVGIAITAFVGGLDHATLQLNTLRRFLELILGILLFFVVVDHVRRSRQLEGLAVLITVCGFLSALAGVVLYVLPNDLATQLLSVLRVFDYPAGSGVLRFIEDNPALAERAISTSIDPNVFGGLLILVTAFTAPQLAAERPLFPRWLTGVFLATMGLAMVLTFSRGAMLGLVAGIAPLMLLRYRRLIPYAVAAGLLLLLLPQAQGYIQRFIAGIQGQDLATQMRFGEYQDALRLIRRYPWFGVGFSGVPDIDLYIGVSSVYLLMAEEMGLIGLGTFLATMLVFFVLVVRAMRQVGNKEGRVVPILFGAASAIFGAMVGGVFDHYFFNIAFPHSVALFWLFIGIALAAARIVRDGEPASAADDDESLDHPALIAWRATWD